MSAQQAQESEETARESRPARWTPLFVPRSLFVPAFNGCVSDGYAPTAAYRSLMLAFFAALDPLGSGAIAPEVFSSFLDAQHYPLHENPWKSALERPPPPHNGDPDRAVRAADYSLITALDDLGFDYILPARPPDRPNSRRLPLLTREGFVAYFAYSHSQLSPDPAHERINAALAHYRVWPELGPLPREMLPGLEPLPLFNRAAPAPEPKRRRQQQQQPEQQDRDPAEGDASGFLGAFDSYIDQVQEEQEREREEERELERQWEAALMVQRQQQQVQEAASMAADLAAQRLRAQGYRNALELVGDVEYEYEYRTVTQRQTRYGPSWGGGYGGSSLV